MIKFENQSSTAIISRFHMGLKSAQTLVATNVPALSCNENNSIILYSY